ncbi:MAG: phenylacetate-CoA oxygenase subunit PaaC [Gammaproteobacteria bacterium]|uniref:1,2-phenylacetyl-CoA epoxidase subunit PaaC n=1 Tax=Nevskia sp. TaxID=1929292 RepID=UPI004035BFF6|nr:phenylacetate-CoA oxygenase subunit PaaC [Gammaproteobacteria bacterium]
MNTARHDYLLRFGDNALILSQRLAEWCGKGPALEEDMALTNTALDLLGQARLWLSLAAEQAGDGADEDTLAYLRDDRAFRNVLLVEQPNGSYASTLARQFLFDAWSSLALRRLLVSSDAAIAAIAEKAVKEVGYHLRRSSDLMVRLGDGTERSHALLQAALDQVWPYHHELFTGDAVDTEMTAAGIGFDPASLRDDWLAYVREVLAEATLSLPKDSGWRPKGGKQGLHSEHLSKLLAEMQVLPRSHPGARW